MSDPLRALQQAEHEIRTIALVEWGWPPSSPRYQALLRWAGVMREIAALLAAGAVPQDDHDTDALVAQMKAALQGWLQANAPGGWIDDLRQRAAGAVPHPQAKQPNPCPTCGAYLWDDPRPCWNCARVAWLRGHIEALLAAGAVPLKLNLSDEWLTKRAAEEEGHEVSAGAVPQVPHRLSAPRCQCGVAATVSHYCSAMDRCWVGPALGYQPPAAPTPGRRIRAAVLGVPVVDARELTRMTDEGCPHDDTED